MSIITSPTPLIGAYGRFYLTSYNLDEAWLVALCSFWWLSVINKRWSLNGQIGKTHQEFHGFFVDSAANFAALCLASVWTRLSDNKRIRVQVWCNFKCYGSDASLSWLATSSLIFLADVRFQKILGSSTSLCGSHGAVALCASSIVVRWTSGVRARSMNNWTEQLYPLLMSSKFFPRSTSTYKSGFETKIQSSKKGNAENTTTSSEMALMFLISSFVHKGEGEHTQHTTL